ncbi:alpha/beta hydrolase [Paenibacillus eucommiae]|uniref:Acetyl esterase/lipase n=1 Tax=Paenibacillus eucommiae TaxID=1355755 RepID=A0ABS4J8G2_9BACL|nr:alpha/beta hydrolase [Paenibacillus eucommiae]MBP1996118.1 acetyl esterase/lipase [Paenibacillus eucommiae]
MELFTRYYDQDLVLKRGVDISLPQRVDHRTALFYVHGGGWSAGSRDLFHTHLQYFSQKGYLCASAGYRLTPKVQLAEQMGDVFAGYETFLSYIREKELDIRTIVVLGSSAGAHLASLLALTLPESWRRSTELRNGPEAAEQREGWLQPAACVSINGPGTLEQWDDMNPAIKNEIERLVGAKYGETAAPFRQASPIVHVKEGSPDFLFLIVGLEDCFPHTSIYEMDEKLKQAGSASEVILFPEAEHGFFYDVKTEHQRQGLTVLEPFLLRYG